MSFGHESQPAAVMPSYLEKSFSIIKKGRGVLEKQTAVLKNHFSRITTFV